MFADPVAPPPSKLLAYVQLMRLPNVFTALADVVMGYLFTHNPDEGAGTLVGAIPLLVATALMYSAGMVLNDVFDVEVDRVERPERPLPSGRVPVRRCAGSASRCLSAGRLLELRSVSGRTTCGRLP